MILHRFARRICIGNVRSHQRTVAVVRARTIAHTSPNVRPLSGIASGPSRAASELSRVSKAFIDAFGECSVQVRDGEVTINLGPEAGTYKLASGTGKAGQEQIMMSSPVSGARWYEWDPTEKSWVSPDDGHHLVEMMSREIVHSTHRYVDL